MIYCHTENATVELKLKLIIMGNLLGRGHTWPHELWCTLVLHRRGVMWTLCGPWGGLWTLWTNDPCGCQPAHSAFELKQLGNKSIILPVEQNYTRVSHNDIKIFTIRLNIQELWKLSPVYRWVILSARRDRCSHGIKDSKIMPPIPPQKNEQIFGRILTIE